MSNKRNLNCPEPCKETKYHYSQSRIASNACYDGNGTHFWAYYDSSRIKVEEEYRLMDLAAIISATGGSLGLFLGFSCYPYLWDLVDKAGSLIQKMNYDN
jgi:hypothetical protein